MSRANRIGYKLHGDDEVQSLRVALLEMWESGIGSRQIEILEAHGITLDGLSRQVLADPRVVLVSRGPEETPPAVTEPPK